jgi:ArsR family transcriptional regulator, arsenate/arsenite/antimonite-responsive transcriptional repressor
MRELEQYFKALADSTRLRILNLLLQGELCVCDIQYVLEISQPATSRHLAYLKNSGMVMDKRDGYRIFYCLTDRNHTLKKLLYDFLRNAFQDQAQLKDDTRRLREAISAGACALSEWKPDGGIDIAAAELTFVTTTGLKR